MARPTVIRDEQILEAARQVFLEHGVAATTAEVARRAGVAEGTIFKRFATKADLFKAAMQLDFDDIEWVRTLISARDGDDPREILYRVGLQAVAFFRRLIPLTMMQFSTGREGTLPPHLIGPNAAPLRALKAVTAFIEREVRAGRMRAAEPDGVARMLLGSIQSYVFFETLYRAQIKMPIPVEHYLRGLIETLWTGVAPTPARRGH